MQTSRYIYNRAKFLARVSQHTRDTLHRRDLTNLLPTYDSLACTCIRQTRSLSAARPDAGAAELLITTIGESVISFTAVTTIHYCFRRPVRDASHRQATRYASELS